MQLGLGNGGRWVRSLAGVFSCPRRGWYPSSMNLLVSTLLLHLPDVRMTCYTVGKSWLDECGSEDVKDLILFLPVTSCFT